jgi:hypothetical protein
MLGELARAIPTPSHVLGWSISERGIFRTRCPKSWKAEGGPSGTTWAVVYWVPQSVQSLVTLWHRPRRNTSPNSSSDKC